jgi:hypothetical protein
MTMTISAVTVVRKVNEVGRINTISPSQVLRLAAKTSCRNNDVINSPTEIAAERGGG